MPLNNRHHYRRRDYLRHADPPRLNFYHLRLSSPPPPQSRTDSPSSQPPTPTQGSTYTPRKPNPKILSLLLQALIMTFVVSLFFIFVGVAAIIFIHLCIAGGALHRRRRRQQPPRPDDAQSGYSSEDLKTLPKIQFKAEADSKSKDICAICLDNVLGGDWCRVLPSCKHLFHCNCIDLWLLKAPACPVCRTAVQLNNSNTKNSEIGADECAQLWEVFH